MPFAKDSYTGNGSTKEFNISFAYIEEGHIKVALNEVATTAFTVDTSTSPKKVVMNTLASETSTQTTTGAPKTGVNVVVQRRSSLNAALVDYTDGSTLIADDLDKSNQQFLFLLQERDDEAQDNIQSTLAGQDAQNKKIINVADPTAAQHAATKNYVDTNFQPLDAEPTELATMSSGTASALADLTQAETQILDGATVTTSELNTLDGITASTAELNKLDGVTADTAELNKLDGVTSTTAELNILDGVTATAAEINTLDGITASTAELNTLNGVTASTAEINKLDGLTPTTAELNFVDGVTSAIQNQINGKQPLDAELTELATMPATTASALADLTQAEVQVLDGATLSTAELNKLDGVTSTTSELNILDGVTANATELNVTDGLTASTSELNQLDGKTISSTLTPANTNDIPTSSVVNTFVSGLLNALGGFVAIPNETSFPTTNPDPSDNAGTVVSIADAGGVVVNSSGVSVTGRTTNGSVVTINGFPSSLQSTTLGAGLGLQVQTTTTLNTYTYHKLIAKEADVKQLSDDINDFQSRYRVSDNAPTTDLDEGDLWYDKTANKMKVYDTSTSAWKEVQSVGNFFINTLSSSSGTGGGSATFNGSAFRFTLSNAGANAQQMLVSVNGVIQKPNSGTSQPSEGFAIDTNDIIFAAAPASGASHFIVTIGSTVNIGQPSNNTVDTSELVDGAVTNAKVSSSAAIASSKIAFNNIDVTGEVQCDSLDVDGPSAFSDRVTVDRSTSSQSCFSARHSGTENALIKADGSATFSQVTVSNGSAVGSSSSSGTLQLQGGGTFPGGNILLGGGSGNDDIRFRTTGASNSSTERVRIDSDGRVGIGTNSMYQHLEINFADTATTFQGTGASGNWGAGSRGIKIENTSNVVGAKALVQYRIEDADYFAGAERTGANNARFIFKKENEDPDVIIESTGHVGIGRVPFTNNTGYPLQVRGNSNQSFIQFSQAAQGDTLDDGMVVGCDNNNAYVVQRENAPLIFYTNNVERMRLLAGGGLTFGGATSSVDALDDYEQGTWNPTIAFGGSSTGVNYVERQGTYVKIGNLVWASMVITLSSNGTGTGDVSISLPFTSGANSETRGTGLLSYFAGFSGLNSNPNVYVSSGNQTTCRLQHINASAGSASQADVLSHGNITNNATFRGSVMYNTF